MRTVMNTSGPEYDSCVQYKDGYKTGFSWVDDYKPGGPWVYRESYYTSNRNDPVNISRRIAARLSQEAHNAWHRGFKAGQRDAALYRLIMPKQPRRNVRAAA